MRGQICLGNKDKNLYFRNRNYGLAEHVREAGGRDVEGSFLLVSVRCGYVP